MSKGESFELAVYRAVKQALRRRLFGLRPEACQVHHHKAYFSRDRGQNLFVDVAIELYLPGATKPWLMWIWECKNYSHPVPVDDLEEFHAKIQQIGEDNTKGTLITSGVLQRSALSYAKSKGIGVARLMPGDKIVWDHKQYNQHYDGSEQISEEERKHKIEYTTELALTDPEFIAKDQGFFAINSAGNAEGRGGFEVFLRREFKASGMLEYDIWREDYVWWWD